MAGHLALNVMRFARLLRGAGFPIGTGKVLDAFEALAAVGIGVRDDVYWALHAVLVDRHERQALFDQAFRLFWRDIGRREAGNVEATTMDADEDGDRLDPRLAEALGVEAGRETAERRFTPTRDRGSSDGDDIVAADRRDTYSGDDVPGDMDFGVMSPAERDAAERAVRRLVLRHDEITTRRWKSSSRGSRLDLRSTLARARRTGGEPIDLAKLLRRKRQPPLVALIDISGSMSAYSQVLLRFLHHLAQRRAGVGGFVFGTRLTNISRALDDPDSDRAMARIARMAGDWSGGTRIAPALRQFNRDWSRRMLSRSAMVLLATDGLERDPSADLDFEAARLGRSCRRLIWLNPLLRHRQYAPIARGAAILARHATEIRPVHSLDSLAALSDALSGRAEAARPAA